MKFAQNSTMAVQIALICLEAVITMMFLPMRIGLTGHVSLARRRAELDVKLFALRLVRVRLFVKNGRFRCTLNGKKFKKPSNDPKKAIKMADKFLCSDIRRGGVAALRIGLDEAMMSAATGAMLQVLLLPLAKGGVYMSEEDSFELDVSINMRINLLQVADIAL